MARDAIRSIVDLTRTLVDVLLRAENGLINTLVEPPYPTFDQFPLPVLMSNESPETTYPMDVKPLYDVVEKINYVELSSVQNLRVWNALTARAITISRFEDSASATADIAQLEVHATHWYPFR